MNVLVIPTWYPNGVDELMGIYHKEFCASLAKICDINVNMLYIDRQRLNAPLKYLTMKKNEVINEAGYNVYIKKMLDIGKISNKLQIKNYVKKMEHAFKEYLKNNPKPDIIHAHVTIPAGYAATILGKKYNIPVLVTEHASYFERFFKDENKVYGDFVLKNAYMSSVSNYMASIISSYKVNCDVIPNLVDTSIFKKERKRLKELKLITIAGLRQGKKIDDIIAALKIIREKGIDATLTVVGAGFLEKYYKERCTELNMDNYVTFVGQKNKEEISKLLSFHNVYVIASNLETFCIPGIEALASGLPIVSTKCKGPEEYISHSCGKLVEIGNCKEMAQAIIDVYNNLDNYKIEDLRKIADRYSSKTVMKKTIEIYTKILDKYKKTCK